MRLTSVARRGEHHVTIPDHDELRVGTLRSVLKAVAEHLEIPADSLIDQLFG